MCVFVTIHDIFLLIVYLQKNTGGISHLYEAISGKDPELTSGSIPLISCQGMSGRTNRSP